MGNGCDCRHCSDSFPKQQYDYGFWISDDATLLCINQYHNIFRFFSLFFIITSWYVFSLSIWSTFRLREAKIFNDWIEFGIKYYFNEKIEKKNERFGSKSTELNVLSFVCWLHHKLGTYEWTNENE